MPARELLILRHAKSSWKTDAPTDFDRPLSKRGRRDAPLVGEWLRRRGWTPDYVIASPARRARQTARRVAKAMGFDRDRIHWDERIYAATPERLLEVLAGVPPGVRRAMIVGHNPGLDSLVERLCGRESAGKARRGDGKLLTTTSVARLVLADPSAGEDNVWAGLGPGTARLVGLVRPREMGRNGGAGEAGLAGIV